MLGTRARANKADCIHSKAMTIRAAGVERVVCESCGNVSFKFLDLTEETEIVRTQFARDVDTADELVGVG